MATKVKKIKMKTHKGCKARFKVTKNGKILRRRAGAGHLMSSKSSKRRRRLRKVTLVHKSDAKRIKILLGA